jgi:SAM-dependent methyltransferase
MCVSQEDAYERLAEIYDTLYDSKDYVSEVKRILNAYQKFNGKNPSTLLDLGSGTGNHIREFVKEGISCIGIEPSLAMWKKSVEKKIEGASFVNTSLEKFVTMNVVNIDLMVSLFNVVNHFLSFKEVEDFLKIASSMTKNLIFDCWNDTAVLADPPRVLVREISSLSVTTTPRFNRQKLCVDLKTKIEHNKIVGIREKDITYTLRVNLWSRELLFDLAKKYYENIKILSSNFEEKDLLEYGIVFYCRNGG